MTVRRQRLRIESVEDVLSDGQKNSNKALRKLRKVEKTMGMGKHEKVLQKC